MLIGCVLVGTTEAAVVLSTCAADERVFLALKLRKLSLLGKSLRLMN